MSSPAPEPILTDFARGVSAIVPALLGRTDRAWLPGPAADAVQVVLLVIDGLGWRAFTDAPEALPTLRGLTGGPTTTVLPATTASALTSITTGTSPGTHGVLGFRMRTDEVVLNNLRWQTEPRGAGAPDPAWIQRQAPFGGQAVPIVVKAEHEGSGFTEAHLRGAPFHGWSTTDELVTACRDLVVGGAPLVYAYYPNVDEVAHEHGLAGDEYRDALGAADALVARLRAALPSSCTLLVTADHGQVHLEPDAWIELDHEVARLVELQAGDARCRFLYARSGRARDLAVACRERYESVAWVATRRELLDAGRLGPVAPGSIAGRVGDVVLMPHAPVGFVDPALPRERGLRSAHGAPTADELLVPLLAG